MIMPSCGAGEALGLAARVAERLREIEFGPAGHVTVSIGIAQGLEHATGPRELVACAEDAMMTAKARGRNRVVLYDEAATERPEPSAPGRRSALDRPYEDAPVARRQAEPLSDVSAIGDDDRERAPAADRLPQLPHLMREGDELRADRVRRRPRQRLGRRGRLHDVGRRGHHRPRRRDRRVAAARERDGVRVRRADPRHGTRSRSRWSLCRSATGPGSSGRS